MADLAELVTALKNTLDTYYTGQGVKFNVYEYVPGQISAPCVIVEPSEGEYHATLGNAPTDHVLAVHAIVSMGDRFGSQMELMPMISATGAKSIKAAVASDPYLGGVVRYADALRYRDFGTRRYNEVDYLMATVEVAIMA